VKLNHLTLTVSDSLVTQAFLQKYFDLRPFEGAQDNSAMAFLQDDNGMVLNLIRWKRDVEAEYPPNFHIGFIQESEEQVNEINRRLKEDGYDVPPPSRQHGSWTFYFRAPGGFTVEVLA
jgi:catechol-2,3-dioxygenase